LRQACFASTTERAFSQFVDLGIDVAIRGDIGNDGAFGFRIVLDDETCPLEVFAVPHVRLDRHGLGPFALSFAGGSVLRPLGNDIHPRLGALNDDDHEESDEDGVNEQAQGEGAAADLAPVEVEVGGEAGGFIRGAHGECRKG